MKICDTTVLVDIDRGGVESKVARLDEERRNAISIVTLTELRLGVELTHDPETSTYREAIRNLDRLLARFDVVPVDRPVAIGAAKIIARLRDQGEQLKHLHDIYVAATARTQESPVLTANVDHFERIPNVSVIDWNQF